MEVHFTPEQEARLAQLANKSGTDPERFVQDLVSRLLENEGHFDISTPDLPNWRLGAVGPFHRRDIYNDVD